MKQTAAIFLMALFAFNLFGYRVLFYFAQKQSDVKIEKALDNNQYDDKDLTEIRIPLSVPYQNQTDFERFDGEVNFNGKIYKYVKRKVSDGNLVLLCLPSNNKMKLESAKNEFFKNATDLQNSGSKKSDNSKFSFAKNLSGDYNNKNSESYQFFAVSSFTRLFSLSKPVLLSSALHCSPEQPPELV